MVDPNVVLIGSLATVLVVTLIAESLHARRIRRLAGLAFGPRERPSWFARCAPLIRMFSLFALTWGVVTLCFLPGKVHKYRGSANSDERHLVVLLDVSPSMRLKDAGPLGNQSRRERCRDIVESFLQRVSTDQYKVSILAFFNGVKPVVEDTTDVELVRHILDELPLYQAFKPGKTKLYEGLKEVVELTRRWGPKTTTVLVLTDGDSESSQGMPNMPASVANVLFVGVGDPRSGSFIAGKQSRQEASMLRQAAIRMRGEYFDGNAKHLPTKLLLQMQAEMNDDSFVKIGRREIALIATGLGGLLYALLPVLLHFFGTGWQPGVRKPKQKGYDTASVRVSA